MANVRLLQQQVEAYQRALERMNKGYEADYGAYKDEVETHNAKVNALKAGGSAWLKESDGKYNRYEGKGDSIRPVSPFMRHVPLVDSLPETGGPVLMLNSSGSADVYVEDNGVWKKHPTDTKVIGDVPTAPKEPKAPNPLGFTEKQKGMLMNPTAGPAEMVAANAKGVAVTSSLAGDDTPAPTSAFANPEDPNNLKDRGVLARVLGGQL